MAPVFLPRLATSPQERARVQGRPSPPVPLNPLIHRFSPARLSPVGEKGLRRFLQEIGPLH
jgi:hypothetical protein